MKKAVFLDRDGTINIDKNYVYRVEDFKFLPGAIDGLKRFKKAGYLLIVITNQSGIARGYYTEEDYNILEKWMLDQLRIAGADIDAVYHCPHLPDAQVEEFRLDCECRKPKIGMFKTAIERFDIDVEKSIVIGDKMRDLTICKNGKTKGFLVYSDKEKKESNIQYITEGISKVADYMKIW